jgi:hypothetical protein
LFLAAGVGTALLLARSAPHDQTVHYVLGDAAVGVEEMVVRWAGADGDWMRQVTYDYARGGAPRIVTHELRLADGDYTVEFEIAASPEAAHRVFRRRVNLSGGATSIDVAGGLSQ